MAWHYLPSKRDQMMFAETEDFNVLHNNHLVVALVEDGVVDDVSDVLLVAFCEEQHCLRISGGRIEYSLSVRVLTNAF